MIMKKINNSKNRLLSSRERALDAARTKLVSINSERTRLETLVQQLKAELREQESLQSSCLSVKIDESKLKQARDLARQVKHRLAVRRKELENNGIAIQVSDIDVKPILEKPRDIRTEVDKFFGRENGNVRLLETAPDKLTQN